MQIQLNVDRKIESGPELARHVEHTAQNALERFNGQITRLEIHLNDENSDKKSGFNDKRCQVEARLAGLQPMSVRHHASTPEMAVDGAMEQLKRALENTIGRLNKRR